MPPKRRRVAAKAREQRRRDERSAAESTTEPEVEQEELSEADDGELESNDEKDARIDAEIEALRVKYGIHDDGDPWRAQQQELKRQSKDQEREVTLQAKLEVELSEVQAEVERVRTENLRVSALGLQRRAWRRAQARALVAVGVPSRSYFDLLTR